MSIFGDPSADVVVSQQAWIAITAEAEKLAAMAKECAAERQALRADRDELQCTVTRRDIAISGLENQVKSLRARVAEAVRMIEGYKRAGLLTNPATAEQATDFISRATGNKDEVRK